MTTITISRNLLKEKELILIPRKKYEDLLRHTKKFDEESYMWQKASKEHFLKFYDKGDAIYDKI